MEKTSVVTFWKNFFTDLLTGAVLSLFLFTFGGFAAGMISVYFLSRFFTESWWQWLGIPLALIWYGAWGIFHGLASSIALTTSRKLSEMVGGLQDLLDLLSIEVIGKFKKFEKNIPKEELAQKFDQFGEKFLDDLRLKKGLLYLPTRMLYGIILKGLKFFFLNDVREEILKSPNKEITSAEIESAVRRLSMGLILSPIQDNFILIQIINCVLMITSFGFPFWLLGKL